MRRSAFALFNNSAFLACSLLLASLLVLAALVAGDFISAGMLLMQIPNEWDITVFAPKTLILLVLAVCAIPIFIACIASMLFVRLKQSRYAAARLHDRLGEEMEVARMLVRKDRELGTANQHLSRLNQEMEEVGRVLVRRDLELSEANTRLEELDLSKSEFVSVAAHQLRTPLTGIRWGLQGILNEEFGKITVEQREVLRTGLRVTLSAIELINNLLDIAHIEGGRFGYKFAEANLADTIRTSLSGAQKRCEDKGIALAVEELPEHLNAVFDGEKIKMVLDNLLDNAIKYTNPGGTIRVGTGTRDNSIEITIADSGIGVPEREQRRLFTKFFRAPNALLLQTSGTGLGLYLVKNIVEEHNGTIDVRSVENKGTTFTIRIPIKAEK